MADEIRLTPRLCRAARSLLGWKGDDLSSASGVPRPTLYAFEGRGEDARLATMNNRAVVQAFEGAGLQFIPENGGGEGVRMRKPREAKG